MRRVSIRATEIIATHLGWDVAEMADYRYQPTRFMIAVYSAGDWYFCSPAAGRRPPLGYAWEKVGEYHGRSVFRSKLEDVE